MPPWLLVITGGATRAGARSTASPGPADSLRFAVATPTDGRKERDRAGCMIAATALAWRRRIGLAHGAELFKGRVAICTVIFVDRHSPVSCSSELSLVRSSYAPNRPARGDVSFGPQARLLYNAFGIRSNACRVGSVCLCRYGRGAQTGEGPEAQVEGSRERCTTTVTYAT
jgi:hypothetical protein